MASQIGAERYLENWQDEVDSAAGYRAMAASESDPHGTMPGSQSTAAHLGPGRMLRPQLVEQRLGVL